MGSKTVDAMLQQQIVDWSGKSFVLQWWYSLTKYGIRTALRQSVFCSSVYTINVPLARGVLESFFGIGESLRAESDDGTRTPVDHQCLAMC